MSEKNPRRSARPPASTEPTQGTTVGADTPVPESKIAGVIRRLRQRGGASLDELIAQTGWQPHTTRAALTGLRKKGHPISKIKVEGGTRYAIPERDPQ